jgi:glycosyltransferase involved in cell wall biosynthesis
MKVSAVIITKNEEAMLPDCLRSLDWVDEIVVLDSGSTDRTLELARAAGAKVSQSADWPGFGAQKNRASALAGGEWILSIDADERVTPELAAEMRRAMADAGGVSAFEIARLSSYCGRAMRHSGWWPDYVTRLYRAGRARFSDDLVHERLIADGPVGRLRGVLRHEPFSSLEQVLDKMNRYSTLGARQMAGAGRSTGLATGVAHGLAAFVKTYLLQAGFLDGAEGFMLAVSNAEGAYYKYLKLRLLRRRS